MLHSFSILYKEDYYDHYIYASKQPFPLKPNMPFKIFIYLKDLNILPIYYQTNSNLHNLYSLSTLRNINHNNK